MPGAALVLVLGSLLFPIVLLLLALVFDVGVGLWAVCYVTHNRWMQYNGRRQHPFTQAAGRLATNRVGAR